MAKISFNFPAETWWIDATDPDKKEHHIELEKTFAPMVGMEIMLENGHIVTVHRAILAITQNGSYWRVYAKPVKAEGEVK
jgi:hypothetical protein